MDEDSLTQDGPDASAIAVGGSSDQGPRQATIAHESGWHDIDHELEQLMSEVEEADPSPPKAVISRAASPPVQQSKPVRMKLSDLLYGNAELQEVDTAVAMRVTLEKINRMNEAEAKTTLTMAAMHKIQHLAPQDSIIRRLEQDVITAKLETTRLQAQMQEAGKSRTTDTAMAPMMPTRSPPYQSPLTARIRTRQRRQRKKRGLRVHLGRETRRVR